MKFTLLFYVVSLLLPSLANAIIIRHDTADELYIKAATTHLHSVGNANGCMATMIAKDWAVTAAHCVDKHLKRPFWVSQLNQKSPVIKHIIHSKYKPNFPGYDIALLQLNWPIESAIPVPLYEQNDETGQLVTFVGNGDFGDGQQGVIARTNKMRAATNIVESVTNKELLFKFDEPATLEKATRPLNQNALMLEGISGPGDSGGPAFIFKGEQKYLAGVSSWQDYHIREGLYGVTEHYARISTSAKWIKSQLIQHKTQLPKPNASSLYKQILAAPSQAQHQWRNATQIERNQLILTLAYILPEQTMSSLVPLIPQLNEITMGDVNLLEYAIELQNWPLVKTLIRHNKKPTKSNAQNEPLISQLVRYFNNEGDIAPFLAALIDKDVNINQTDKRGLTPLAHAVYLASNGKDTSNSIDHVDQLLKFGANPNITTHDGYSPLMEASRRCHNKLMTRLISAGANKKLTDASGKTQHDYYQKNCN